MDDRQRRCLLYAVGGRQQERLLNWATAWGDKSIQELGLDYKVKLRQ